MPGYARIFRRDIPSDLLEDVLRCFNLNSLSDTWQFSKRFLMDFGTVGKLHALYDRMCEVYIPCKARVYLTNLTPVKCVTVLKQVLRHVGYQLNTKEVVRNQNKTTFYQVAHSDTCTRSAIACKFTVDHDIDVTIDFT